MTAGKFSVLLDSVRGAIGIGFSFEEAVKRAAQTGNVSHQELLSYARADRKLMAIAAEYDAANHTIDAELLASLDAARAEVDAAKLTYDTACAEYDLAMDALQASLPDTVYFDAEDRAIKARTFAPGGKASGVKVKRADGRETVRAQSGESVNGAGRGRGNNHYTAGMRGSVAPRWGELHYAFGETSLRVYGKLETGADFDVTHEYTRFGNDIQRTATALAAIIMRECAELGGMTYVAWPEAKPSDDRYYTTVQLNVPQKFYRVGAAVVPQEVETGE